MKPYAISLTISTLLMAATLSPTPGHAITLLNDNFNSATGGGSAAGSIVTSTNIETSETVDWTKSSTNGIVGVGAFAGSGNTTNSLTLTTGALPDTGSFKNVFGSFTSISLGAIGDTITLTLDFRLTTAGSYAEGLRLGFGNSAVTYAMAFGTGAPTTLAGDIKRYGPNTGTGASTVVTTSGTDFSINNTTSHTFSFTLTRTASGLDFLGQVDGGNTFTGSDGAANFGSDYLFDTVVFAAQPGADPDVNFNIDNVIVTSSVPEPSAYALLGVGAAAFGILRRRLRQKSP